MATKRYQKYKESNYLKREISLGIVLILERCLYLQKSLKQTVANKGSNEL